MIFSDFLRFIYRKYLLSVMVPGNSHEISPKARLVEPLGLRMAHGPLPAPLMRLLLLSVEARGCPECCFGFGRVILIHLELNVDHIFIMIYIIYNI